MMSGQQSDDAPIVLLVEPQEDTGRNALCPLMIFQVLQGDFSSCPCESNSAVCLTLGEKQFGYATLVAHVISVEISPAKATYILEDGTGRIYAEKYLDSLTHHSGLSTEVEKEEIVQYKTLEDSYVQVIVFFKMSHSNRPRLWIKSIYPIYDYHQVMHHVLHVVYTQWCIQPHDSDRDSGANEDMEAHMPVEDDQACDINIQHHINTFITPASPAILSNMFSLQRHQPYTILDPLERTIMKYMKHHRNQCVLITDLAQAIQALCGCTESQFSLAFHTLLSEAYLTSPLDDGHVVVTPRQ